MRNMPTIIHDQPQTSQAVDVPVAEDWTHQVTTLLIAAGHKITSIDLDTIDRCGRKGWCIRPVLDEVLGRVVHHAEWAQITGAV